MAGVSRNLSKADLGGVIFICNNKTMPECLQKQLFGLGAMHFSYVKNIEPGLPLFLFNFSDRKLHGNYVAVSHGQMNIDPYAWTGNSARRTHFPAQVRMHIRMPCYPLLESQFKDVIRDNYNKPSHFCCELDDVQTQGLISLFTPLPLQRYVPVTPPLTPTQNIMPAITSSRNSYKRVLSTITAGGYTECIDNANLEPKTRLELSVDISSLSRPSFNPLVDLKQKVPVSDLEELVDEKLQVAQTCSGEHPCCDEVKQSLQEEKSGNVQINGNCENMLQRLQVLSANGFKECMKDTVVPSGAEEIHENGAFFSEKTCNLIETVEHSSASSLYYGDTEPLRGLRELRDQLARLVTKKMESIQEITELTDRVTDCAREIQVFKYSLEELESENDLIDQLQDYGC